VSGEPPASPAAGSTAWFVLLYAGARKPQVQALFALADELAASFDPALDHQVAHLRLAWWREEAARAGRGEARHPYTRALQRTALALDGLLTAAELELARPRVNASAAQQIPPVPFERGLFLACAQVLHGAPLPGPVLAAMRAWAGQLTAGVDATSTPAPPQPQASEPSQTPPWPSAPALAPLAVWVTLARRRGPSPGATTTGWQLFVDNLRAWRSARAAVRGRFA
jgi:hypothetical protein